MKHTFCRSFSPEKSPDERHHCHEAPEPLQMNWGKSPKPLATEVVVKRSDVGTENQLSKWQLRVEHSDEFLKMNNIQRPRSMFVFYMFSRMSLSNVQLDIATLQFYPLYMPSYLATSLKKGFSTAALLTCQAGPFFVVVSVLYTVECIAASLASTHSTSVESPLQAPLCQLKRKERNFRYCQLSLGGQDKITHS